MPKRIGLIWFIGLAICLSLAEYYSIVFFSYKLSEKADVKMHIIARVLKEHFETHKTFPQNIDEFLQEQNLATGVAYGPFSTEIKVYVHEEESCSLEYLEVPFGPLAGMSFEGGDVYYIE